MLVTLCFEQLNVVLHEKPSKHGMNHYVLVNDFVVYQDEWHEWCSIDSTKAKHLGVCEVSHPMMRVESACYIAKQIAESLCSKVEIDEMVVQSSQEFFGANSVFGPLGDVKTRIRKAPQKKGGRVDGFAWESGNPHATDVQDMLYIMCIYIYTDTVLKCK